MPAKEMWFGFLGSVVAWLVLGCVDIAIVWRACQHQEDFGIPSEHSAVSVVLFAVALIFLGITVGAGILSYHNFRKLSEQRRMLDSPAVPRGEFMAVVGVILSVTLPVTSFQVSRMHMDW
jgi:hypothetical protein